MQVGVGSVNETCNNMNFISSISPEQYCENMSVGDGSVEDGYGGNVFSAYLREQPYSWRRRKKQLYRQKRKLRKKMEEILNTSQKKVEENMQVEVGSVEESCSNINNPSSAAPKQHSEAVEENVTVEVGTDGCSNTNVLSSDAPEKPYVNWRKRKRQISREKRRKRKRMLMKLLCISQKKVEENMPVEVSSVDEGCTNINVPSAAPEQHSEKVEENMPVGVGSVEEGCANINVPSSAAPDQQSEGVGEKIQVGVGIVEETCSNMDVISATAPEQYCRVEEKMQVGIGTVEETCSNMNVISATAPEQHCENITQLKSEEIISDGCTSDAVGSPLCIREEDFSEPIGGTPSSTHLRSHQRPQRISKSSLEQEALTNEVLLSVRDHFKRPAILDDRFEIFGRSVSLKLRDMHKHQRILAEKIISETLFEAEMGTLTRSHRLTGQDQHISPSHLPMHEVYLHHTYPYDSSPSSPTPPSPQIIQGDAATCLNPIKLYHLQAYSDQQPNPITIEMDQQRMDPSQNSTACS